MIYLSDDYVTKYQDTISYIIERAIEEQYSIPYIERTIAYSDVFSSLEKSNITKIAFSSMEFIYHELFPLKDNNNFVVDIYGKYGWIGYIYLHLFFDLRITFETLFIVCPIKEMLSMYHLYHEMDYVQTLNYVKSLVKYSYLDNIMKSKDISSASLANMTGIPFATINALRYGKRNISKLEASKLYKIATALNMKMESLLPSLPLVFDQ